MAESRQVFLVSVGRPVNVWRTGSISASTTPKVALATLFGSVYVNSRSMPESYTLNADYSEAVNEELNGNAGSYIFAGWYAQGSGASGNTWDIANNYNVRVSTSSKVQISTLLANGNIGWYQSGSYQSCNLCAKYAVAVTVTFKDWDGTTLKTQRIAKGGDATPPADPTRAGYTFAGWSGNYTNVQSNTTVTATYTGNSIGVFFNANGGTVSSMIKVVTVGGPYGTLPTPTRSGYVFAGWYTAASGGTLVTDSTTVTETDVHTLYAHWGTQLTVTFNANGGTVSPTSKTVTAMSAYGTLPTPTRSGYVFSGWYTTSGGGSLVTSSTTVSVSYDHTLYAQWTGDSITVTFDANGGTVSPSSKTLHLGDLYGELPIPTRSGYNFIGWYTAASGGDKASGGPTGDITLYAHWTLPLPEGGTEELISKFTPNIGE